MLRVLDLLVFVLVLPHGLVHVIGRVTKDIAQTGLHISYLFALRTRTAPVASPPKNHLQLDGSLSCAHALDKTERDVLALLGNVFVAEKLGDLEQLPQM